MNRSGGTGSVLRDRSRQMKREMSPPRYTTRLSNIALFK
ncbi:hypothetical protein [Pantoea agglomerans]|nr:hypothetical protein [Pantoea agglomerans]